MNEAHQQILRGPAATQHQCPLFCVLPPEVRAQIFALALTDYPDPDPEKKYATDTCYTRPSYFSPRRTDTELLRTCRAVYREAWHMPFTLREHVQWLTQSVRAPPGTCRNRLQQCLRQIAEWLDEDVAEISSLRVFAQMFILERGELASLLKTPYLRPRALTLTIRHADWWFWESDEPLRFEGDWIRGVCEALPGCVGEIHIELESLLRKKKQVDGIAKQMAERWFFKRPDDGAVLYADNTVGAVEVNQWRGTSTWQGQRWIRDEAEPGQIDFYVVTVSFRPESVVTRRGGSISEQAKRFAQRDWFNKDLLRLHLPDATAMRHNNPSISVDGGDDLYSSDHSSPYDPQIEWLLADSDEAGDDDDDEYEGDWDEGEEEDDVEDQVGS